MDKRNTASLIRQNIKISQEMAKYSTAKLETYQIMESFESRLKILEFIPRKHRRVLNMFGIIKDTQ